MHSNPIQVSANILTYEREANMTGSLHWDIPTQWQNMKSVKCSISEFNYVR
jgi:hypothetical protein